MVNGPENFQSKKADVENRAFNGKSKEPLRIALYLTSFGAGGVKRSMLHLAEGLLDHGCSVDLIVDSLEGPYAKHIPEGIKVKKLTKSNKLWARYLAFKACPHSRLNFIPSLLLASKGIRSSFPGLISYLKTHKPDCLIAARPPLNIAAVLAKKLAGVSTHIVISERSTLSSDVAANHKKSLWFRYLPSLIGTIYPYADSIVAVSQGVADDLAATTGLPRSSISTIYNPVVTPQITSLETEEAPHPWLENSSKIPVIVAAGRLSPVKNFPMLLRAFAKLRNQQEARLVIFGEGNERTRLESSIKKLGLEKDVDLPGYISNPYAAFARASLFVLSSNYEGLPTVLIEAMSCGCPVVATDCPGGPAEILEYGRYGELVPVEDASVMAKAIKRALFSHPSSYLLRQRANQFDVKCSTRMYLKLIQKDNTK